MPFKTLYTAHATVTGGRSGRGTTESGSLEVELALPAAMGGPGGPGTNPEELFAVGYAACFESALSGAAGELNTADVSIRSTVELGKMPDGIGLQVTLDVTLPSLSDEDAAVVVGKAHRLCPYSKAIRGNVDVTLIANGKTLVG